MAQLFHGGIHPRGHKSLSAGGALRPLQPKEVTVPLRQHIGSPCRATVAVGERVLLGQVIGTGQGLWAPVHASLSGTVRQVTEAGITIESDGRYEAVPPVPAGDEAGETIVRRVHRAGVVGMGGAAFPTAEKLRSAAGKADTVIANGCECEPYLTADQLLMTTAPHAVLRGLVLAGRAVGASRLVLAVEEDKATAIEALRRQLGEFPTVELQVLPVRYPQGSEKQLILSVTGREVPPGGLPSAVGCCVVNVATCAAIHRAVDEGRPLTERIVTVTGEAVGKPGNFLVPLGTGVKEVLRAAGGLQFSARQVLLGGPMMGRAITDLTAPVMKSTGAVVCLPWRMEGETGPCIRCGRCVAACPMHLLPLYLHYYRKNVGKLEDFRLLDCIECGCCAYVCPSRLPLVAQFREAKQRVKEARP